MEYQNEQILIETLQHISESLGNMDKTLAEPKDISAWRIASNRKISAVVEYIAKIENEIENDPFVIVEVILNNIKKILLSKE